MTEQQRPDEDVEGHGYKWSQDTEAVDEEEGSADDVAGHARIRLEDEASDDDVEGHSPSRRPL
jgi:hypothetical protein